MTSDIPAETTDIDEVPMDELSNIVILNDTGSVLHYFPNAEMVYSDHTDKGFTTTVITADGDERPMYCGNIVYAGNPNPNGPGPTPAEMIEKHGNTYRDGEEWWGKTL